MEDNKIMKAADPTVVLLSKEMRDAVMKAERDYEDGKCFSETDFKERFAKWL